MKIVLFGEDVFTATVLHSLVVEGHRVEAVICPQYNDNIEFKSLEKSAKKNQVSFIHQKNINDDEIRNYLLDIKPDLIVCVHLRKILIKAIYSLAARGAINVHPSMLPKYRGLSPQHQALMNGDTETGVTVHFIDEMVDTGDIIIQQKISLDSDTYVYDLQIKMLQIYKNIVPEALRLIQENGFEPIKQDSSQSSFFGPLKKSDREIDLKKTKFAIYNVIRAVSKPYKGAFYKNINIWASYIPNAVTEKEFLEGYNEIGIYSLNDKLLIRLHDGVLLSDDFEIAIS